jgi:ADP-ribose pyrophosphatase YjhB (NUDIX family)
MTFPVSIKGVVLDEQQRVLLLRNDRDEWELPGGRIEIGESPQETVVREIAEEIGWTVTAGPLLDAWLFRIEPVDRHVFVVAYGCHLVTAGPPVLTDENRGFGLFDAAELPGLPLPDGYRRAIEAWRAARHP